MIATKKKVQSGTKRRRASASGPISITLLEQAQMSLTGLPEKPKEGLRIGEAVEEMQDAIVGALAKGYSYEDVAALLNEKGIDINAPSLKYHLSRLKKTKRTRAAKGTTIKRRRTKVTEIPEASSEPDAVANPSSEAPAKTQRRTKTATQASSQRAAAKTKAAAEASVALPSSTPSEPVAKGRSTRSATKTKAPTEPAASSKTTSKAPSARSRKK